MFSKNPSSSFYRGAAAAVLFLSVSTLALTSTRGKLLASPPQHHAATAAVQPPDAAAVAREAQAKTFVLKVLQTWQDRMDLNEWNIQVNLVRANSLEANTLGNIHWDMRTRRATIEVLSSYDYTMPWEEMLKDMEFTVVHELVHLDLASLPRSTASRRNEEHAVNQLANALLKLANK
jgi:hypothetical protein